MHDQSSSGRFWRGEGLRHCPDLIADCRHLRGMWEPKAFRNLHKAAPSQPNDRSRVRAARGVLFSSYKRGDARRSSVVTRRHMA